MANGMGERIDCEEVILPTTMVVVVWYHTIPYGTIPYHAHTCPLFCDEMHYLDVQQSDGDLH
jgi:hypothetical protein